MSIPHRILRFWHQPDTLPQPIQDVLTRSEAACAQFEHRLWSDEDACGVLARHYGSAYLKLYQRLRIPAARSDLARMLMLYHEGGLYMDASFELKASPAPLLGDDLDCVFIRRDDNHAAKRVPDHAPLANSVMAACPNNPIIRRCIDHIFSNLIDGDLNQRLVHAMGSGVLTSVVDAEADRRRIGVMGIEQFSAEYAANTRVPGTTNTWLEMQPEGVVEQSYHRGHSATREWRLSLFGHLIHLRFSRFKP